MGISIIVVHHRSSFTPIKTNDARGCAVYPNAAIILNTRPSAASWVKSFQGGIGFFTGPVYKYVCILWETDRLHYQVSQSWGSQAE